MKSRHEKTLAEIFKNLVQSTISWNDVESLLVSVGAEITEGNGERAVFHTPHPQKETDKGAIVSMRRFLENAGVKL